MEAPLQRPSHKRKRSTRIETTFEATGDVVAVTEESDDSNPATSSHEEVMDEDLVTGLQGLQLQLVEMKNKVASNQQLVQQKRIQAKKDVKELFDILHELLERKESELNANIDQNYDEIDGDLETALDKLHSLKDPVEEMIDKHRYGVGGVTDEMIRNILTETRSQLNSRELYGFNRNIPHVILNMESKNVIAGLQYGEMSNGESVPQSNNETDIDVALERLNTNGSNSNLEDEYHDTEEDTFEEAETLEAAGGNEVFDESDSEHRYATFEDADFDNVEEGATATAIPSAPPVILVQGEEEGNPPPYWQAIGLPGPIDEPAQAIAPPLNTRSYSDPAPQYCEFDTNPVVDRHNTLEMWHSFPIRRQRDIRTPLYVSLSWDDRRICVADRSNRKVKFFSRTGDTLTEMHISSGEIHNIAYLEESMGEARYIITLPREKTLLLVAVMQDNTTKLVRKIVMQKTGKYYTSICRGPKEQTLVGAATSLNNSYHSTEIPRVEMIDFEGNLLQVYKGSISFVSFEYPKAVEVVGDLVVVADWKLSLVAIFHYRGSQIMEYHGTTSSPLINPLDISIDCFGNILVVDGENPSIHVISPQGYPVEVIKVPRCGSDRGKPKLVAFDRLTRDRLAVISSTGNLAIFSFRDGYKNIPQHMFEGDPWSHGPQPTNDSLPYVEGMLPTTIASIRERGNRNRPTFTL